MLAEFWSPSHPHQRDENSGMLQHMQQLHCLQIGLFLFGHAWKQQYYRTHKWHQNHHFACNKQSEGARQKKNSLSFGCLQFCFHIYFLQLLCYCILLNNCSYPLCQLMYMHCNMQLVWTIINKSYVLWNSLHIIHVISLPRDLPLGNTRGSECFCLSLDKGKFKRLFQNMNRGRGVRNIVSKLIRW